MSTADEELLAEMLKAVEANMVSLRDAYQQRAQLTAVGTAANKLVTIVVNADGVVIETRMADDIADELSPAEIAKAVTTAAQQACAEVKRKADELAAPMRERHAGMPKLSELLPGLPDELSLPTLTEASTAPPGSAEREEPDAERNGTRRAGPGVTEPGW
ncbi:YbaB/EbfC family nucleoid-associated protein [Nocardia sp. NPDC051463]|uniref:YbaB/EbfC family nucleoid-associated protein n=1 Tax=Nocardia sp. NPDC051463 TaxID=3154845 RepID=UPI003434B70D